MDFGKLPNVDDVDFSLPDDHPHTKRLLANLKKPKKVQIYIGAPVWGDKGFIGKIYPPKTKSSDYLSLYSKQFNCIEMNTTFYNMPNQDSVLKWKEEVSGDFKFCPKINQIITHRLNLKNAEQITEDFCNSISHFENQLGITFGITSPYFRPDKFSVFERYLATFPKGIPLSFEVRHEDWFSDRAIMEDLFSMMESYGISSIITDVAGRRDVCHMRLTTSTAVIRFGGNNLHPTDFPRLDKWVDRIKTWIEGGIETIYFWMHTPQKALTADLTVYFINRLNKECKTNLIAPKLISSKNDQEMLF